MFVPIFQSRKLGRVKFLGEKNNVVHITGEFQCSEGFCSFSSVTQAVQDFCHIKPTHMPKHTKETFGILPWIWVCTLIPILIWVHYLNFMWLWHQSRWSCSYSAGQSFLICSIWIPSCELVTTELLEPLKIFWPHSLSLNFLVRWFHLFFSSSYCCHAGARY